MTNTAANIDSIVESEDNFEHQTDGEIVEFDFRHRDSISINCFEEIDAWARHCFGLNGFGDY